MLTEAWAPGTQRVSGALTAVPVRPVLHTRTQIQRDRMTPRCPLVL